MAGFAHAIRIAVLRAGVLAVSLAVVCPGAGAQPRISLKQLGSRSGPNFTAVYSGQKVVVKGIVSASSFHFPEYTMLAIQDDRAGGILKVPLSNRSLDRYRPGDELEATGTVSAQFGMNVLEPEKIIVTDRRPAPAPKDLRPGDLQSLEYLGMLVSTQSPVVTSFRSPNGAGVFVSGPVDNYRIFIPQAPGKDYPNVNSIRVGDTVRVTGIALQYCPVPPFNTGYQLLTAGLQDIVTQPSTIPQPLIAAGITTIVLVGFFLWRREQRLRSQRRRLRRTYKLGEEILGASSSATILKRISEALPGIIGVTRVQLYVYNRTAKTLDAIEDQNGASTSISLSSPPGGTPAGAVACFHYRTLLVIPDIERSPFPIAGQQGERCPKSLLFVPMMAQSEVVGVLELDQDDRVRDFTADEQALAQHLGNQIGVAIRLLDQRTVQEQLFRTEKMAAMGRLISGVVNELQTPLASITDLATRALEKARGGPAEREVSAIATEAAKASGMVTRMVSFAAAEQVEARAVDVTAILRNLIEFREGDWKASGIRVRDLSSHEPIFVHGSPGQIEQVFLNLLVHAEQSLANSQTKSITVRTSLLAKRLLVEISFTSPGEFRKPEDTAAVLGVTRSVIVGHGGEVRLIEKSNSDPRFEVELPALVKDRSLPSQATTPVRDSSRRLTALVIEADENMQQVLLGLLHAHGYRVVPVNNSDAGLDLAQRMRFDVAFCSVHAPGLNWVELSERMHGRVGGFVLLSDGYDAELSADFEGDGRFVLAKPVQEKELERVLQAIEPPTATVIPFKTGTA
ncbi:MAG: response regulator receiver modulated sensor protein [Candidatus Solibacter sp.]|nr:response regulator receiver modulated sensor protein [Candidatus Solibacter sp.]